MKQDFFTYLPTEITTNILSRLPIRSIAISKCVCKSWLNLLRTDEFVNSHLAKSVPGLAVLMPETDSCLCAVFEFEDGINLEHHDLHYKPLTKFDFPHYVIILGSANGLLLLFNHVLPHQALYVCNPVNREYIEIHYPKEFECWYPQADTFGFGVSKITGQYKVVRISIDSIYHKPVNAKYECHVHTLGTESWRSIEPGAPFKYDDLTVGAFLNGNLHWIVSDSNGNMWISCFDLETECFSTFSTPPLGSSEFLVFRGGLTALENHLCLCDNTHNYKIVLWLMKEYGVDKSWTKLYVENPEFYGEAYVHVYSIKVFRDGDILMLCESNFLFYYSSKTKTTEELSISEPHHIMNLILLTPSFLSLRSLGICHVISF